MATPPIDAEKLRAWRDRAARALGNTRAERAAALCTLVLVALGLVFRARGFLFGVSPFWLDECSWAVYLFDQRFGDDNLRPVGFMAVSEFVARFISSSESALRTLPWLAGVATTLMAPLIARRLYTERAVQVLFVAIIALHPAAIDFSKEFKPYSVSLALHATLLLLTLRYAADGSIKTLLGVLLAAAVGNLFAQDLVFAYPGVFLVLGIRALARPRRDLPLVVLGGAIVVASLALQYWLIWSRIPEDESNYWGNKYNVFHTGADGQPYLGWLAERLFDTTAYPGYRRVLWKLRYLSGEGVQALRGLDTALWSILTLVGLGFVAFAKKWRLLLLLPLPIGVLWLFNWLEYWPLGAFRTNLFVLLYGAALAPFAVDRALALWKRHDFMPLVPTVALVVAPLFAFDHGFHRLKRGQAHEGFMPYTLSKLGGVRLREVTPVKVLLLMGTRGCPQWEYYSRFHPRAQEITGVVKRMFHVRCRADEDLARVVRRASRNGARVWVLLQGDLTAEKLAKGPPGDRLDIVEHFTFGWLRVAGLAKPGFTPPPLLKTRGGVRVRPPASGAPAPQPSAGPTRRP
jgi:4-amino-4-deoxy-L-arabinose transferase-like glycosyltransferase